MSQAPTNAYDETPYPGGAYAQSHVDRLETLAALFGLQAPDIRACRVLELGCAEGINLIPMACALPESQFVGIDLSRRQLEAGWKTIATLGLANIKLHHADIRDVDKSFGTFDYVIAHGVYSWVPAEVQEKILTIAHDRLAENGVAYISYNTNPGWRMRGMLRDMMLFHARKFDDPRERIEQARALVQWLGETVQEEQSPYALLLRRELEHMQRWQDAYFRHDSLAEFNEPLYFHQFVERAERHGLQFLAEAELATMLASNLAAPASETLNRIGRNIVELEQYMDFVRNRMFRQTLLCHRNVKLSRALGPWTLHDLRVSALLPPVAGTVDLASLETAEFRTPAAQKVSTAQPIVKATFILLTELWSQSVPLFDLVAQSRARLAEAGVPPTTIPSEKNAAEAIGGVLLTCLGRGACELHVHPGSFVVTPTERPRACPYARLQAERGTSVTNRRHESVELDNFGRQTLLRLNGRTDHSALVEALTDLTLQGTLVINVDHRAVTAPSEIRRIMAGRIGPKLQQFARQALLEA